MNACHALARTLRQHVTEWYLGVTPLLRKDAPRLVLWTGLPALLWLAGAWCNTRYETFKPHLDITPVDLVAYSKRAQNIPKEQNRAWAYLEADSKLGENRALNNVPEANDSSRGLTQEQIKQRQSRRREWLADLVKSTDSVINEMRARARAPHCEFPVSVRSYGPCRRSMAWPDLNTLTDCLSYRATFAAVQRDAAAWNRAMDDLVGLAEALDKEYAPAMLCRQNLVVDAIFNALVNGCRNGAVDEAGLARLDERLNGLHPLQAIEPLLAFVAGTVCYAYPFDPLAYECYKESFYFDSLQPGGLPSDEAYCISGLAARDRFLCVDYVNSLALVMRTEPEQDAFAWMKKKARGHRPEVSFHYNTLLWLTPTWYGGSYGGTPGLCYGTLSQIRMARAVIALMRHGRDEEGLFRAGEPAIIKELLAPFRDPHTGAELTVRLAARKCEMKWTCLEAQSTWLRKTFGATVILPESIFPAKETSPEPNAVSQGETENGHAAS